ncbi:hypothetical protein [Georgenia sp. SUBG003]|uniref:hypothetical protein n=1 Tax=Georgenia sp. SUBG003 TaxID=1497974 RepID=UPI003AB794FC
MVALCDAAHPSRWSRHLAAAVRQGPKLLQAGEYAARLARHGIRLRTRTVVTEILGEDKVTSVRLGRVDARGRVVGEGPVLPADAVALGWGFTPQLELPLMLGTETALGADGGLVVRVDAAQRSSVREPRGRRARRPPVRGRRGTRHPGRPCRRRPGGRAPRRAPAPRGHARPPPARGRDQDEDPCPQLRPVPRPGGRRRPGHPGRAELRRRGGPGRRGRRPRLRLRRRRHAGPRSSGRAHPDLLAGVGLLDTRAAADPSAARADRLRVAAEADGPAGAGAVAPMVQKVLGPTSHAERPDVVERVRDWLRQAPPSGISWAQRAMAARPDRIAALEGLDVPALVLRGAEDVQSSQEDAESMAAALADVEVVVVPRAGHLSAVEQPHEVAAALRSLRERCLRA